MRVTRESLIKIARETAQERAYNDKEIIAAYLTGALVDDTVDPIFGGTADIDIILVHKDEPKHRREFTRLTPDFHVDITHRAKSEFKIVDKIDVYFKILSNDCINGSRSFKRNSDDYKKSLQFVFS